MLIEHQQPPTSQRRLELGRLALGRLELGRLELGRLELGRQPRPRWKQRLGRQRKLGRKQGQRRRELWRLL
jgi:hypothetical protein